MLTRLIYHSLFAHGPHSVDDAQLGRILDASRRNNDANGVTGLLLHDTIGFLQLLEGPKEAVSATFLRISRDTRHTGIVLDGCWPVAERLFPAWTMAASPVLPDVRRDVLSWARNQTASTEALRATLAGTRSPLPGGPALS